uniref:Uncharacterized protein n=1 Tax=Phage sp. ctesc4 TaxID=2828008 RepID=A0A8S5TDG6_9VIRU|nr:MAG TPA: hypothetical protein [Phage sp. ctesc4]
MRAAFSVNTVSPIGRNRSSIFPITTFHKLNKTPPGTLLTTTETLPHALLQVNTQRRLTISVERAWHKEAATRRVKPIMPETKL